MSGIQKLEGQAIRRGPLDFGGGAPFFSGQPKFFSAEVLPTKIFFQRHLANQNFFSETPCQPKFFSSNTLPTKIFFKQMPANQNFFITMPNNFFFSKLFAKIIFADHSNVGPSFNNLPYNIILLIILVVDACSRSHFWLL